MNIEYLDSLLDEFDIQSDNVANKIVKKSGFRFIELCGLETNANTKQLVPIKAQLEVLIEVIRYDETGVMAINQKNSMSKFVFL